MTWQSRCSQRLMFIVLAVAWLQAGGCGVSSDSSASTAPAMLPDADSTQAATHLQDQTPMVTVRVFNEQGELVGPIEMPPVIKTDEEWRAQLTPEQYRITRNAGTEPAFCGDLLDNKLEGVYTCICCNLPLFSSEHKFSSGTGWPSYFQPVAKENIAEKVDRSHGMVRTEILCMRCDAHLGHVFNDGPRPTGLRYCLNSESLSFTKMEDVQQLADPAVKPAEASSDQSADRNASTRTAVFAGGCFWCVEAVFEELEGVIDAISGYAGGTEETANYPAVKTGRTGHAEVVQIIYDPSKISYEDLLRVHFATHDPTQLNRQGNDIGPQYRSAIFYADEAEKAIAQAFIEDLTESGLYEKPIVTALEPLEAFYMAEAYHQDYVCNNPMQPYIRGVALPKVEKVREKFKDLLKDTSPLDQKDERPAPR